MGHSYIHHALTSCCIFNARFSNLALTSISSLSISYFPFYWWSLTWPFLWPSVAIFILLPTPIESPLLSLYNWEHFQHLLQSTQLSIDCCTPPDDIRLPPSILFSWNIQMKSWYDTKWCRPPTSTSTGYADLSIKDHSYTSIWVELTLLVPY
jgi:hypothetical protein